jgi:hypothetical protein
VRRPRAAARFRRALRLPRLSGWVSALVMLLCLVLTAVLVPLRFKLAGWIEAELVVAGWWLTWGTALTFLCYHHALVEDDAPRPDDWRERAGRWGSSGFDTATVELGSLDGESGLVGCLASVLVSILLVAALWFFVEIVFPLLALTMYLLVRGMLAHALNRRHRCRGHLGRSLAWAWLWATLYTAPLAALVWLIHTVAHRA